MFDTKNNRGFSLVELMVVLVIIGILATGVVMSFLDPTAKVKGAAFETRGDFNLARAEAVRRNDDIVIDFFTTAKETCSKVNKASYEDCFAGGTLHGYVICLDEDTVDGNCQNEVRTAPPATAAQVAEDLEEKIIKTTLFNKFVKFYNIGATAPANGPSAAPNGAVLTSNNGITFGGDFIIMNPDGTSGGVGAVVIYYPDDPASATPAIRGKPYAMEIGNANTGNVQLQRWRDEWGGGTWSTK